MEVVGEVIGMEDPEGVIVTYHIAYTKEVLVRVPGVNMKRDAAKFIGQKAVWNDPKGKKYVKKRDGIFALAIASPFLTSLTPHMRRPPSGQNMRPLF